MFFQGEGNLYSQNEKLILIGYAFFEPHWTTTHHTVGLFSYSKAIPALSHYHCPSSRWHLCEFVTGSVKKKEIRRVEVERLKARTEGECEGSDNGGLSLAVVSHVTASLHPCIPIGC